MRAPRIEYWAAPFAERPRGREDRGPADEAAPPLGATMLLDLLEPRDGAARRLAPLHRYVDERAGLEGLGGGAAELRVGNTAALVDLVLEGVEEQLAVDEEPRAVVHLRVEREDLVEGRAHEARPPHRDVVPARVRDRVLDLELEVDAVVDARRRGTRRRRLARERIARGVASSCGAFVPSCGPCGTASSTRASRGGGGG